MIRRCLLLTIVMAVSTWAVTGLALAQDAAAGKAVFQGQCSICHAVQAHRNTIGPSLFGIVGTPAGQVPGFHFSPAIKNSGLTWDAATLDRFLAKPNAVIPHTAMTYTGLHGVAKRANLIAYLSTLH